MSDPKLDSLPLCCADDTQVLLERISELEECNAHLRLAKRTYDRNLKLFGALLERNREGITITAPDRRILRVVHGISQYPEEELLGNLIELYVHQDDRQQIVDAYRRLLKEHTQTEELFARLIRRDRCVRWLWMTLTDMLDDPDVHAIICNYADVTEERRNQFCKLELAALVETSHYSIFSKSAEGTILSWNHGAEITFGYSEQEIVGQHVWTLVPEDLRNEELRMRSTICQGQQVSKFQTEHIRKDGTRVPIWLQLAPVLDEGGDVRSISHISREISPAAG